MLKFKSEKIFDKFMNLSDANITYKSLEDFSKDHNLNFGIINYDDKKDTLYLATNYGTIKIDEFGLVDSATGDYAKYKNGNFEELKNKLNSDIEEILTGNYDIMCINSPIVVDR